MQLAVYMPKVHLGGSFSPATPDDVSLTIAAAVP